MKWKRNANFIIVCILSLAYTIVTLLDIIGPLHMNATGAMNQPGILSIYSIIYYVITLLITWLLYFWLKNKPELLFFVLLVVGIAVIYFEVFLWGWMGS